MEFSAEIINLMIAFAFTTVVYVGWFAFDWLMTKVKWFFEEPTIVKTVVMYVSYVVGIFAWMIATVLAFSAIFGTDVVEVGQA